MNRTILPKRAISETLAPLYVWFKFGYADISLPMAIVSAGGVVILLLKSWGVDIQPWMFPVAFVSVVAFCILYGFLSVRYHFQNKVNDYINKNTNPQVAMIEHIARDVEDIKRTLGEKP